MTARRILFLDIDGVLNSAAYLKQNPGCFDRSGHEAWHMIDEAAVARLNRVLDATDADVVLSSTWRLLNALADVRGWLKRRGFTGKLIGKTPDIGKSPGGVLVLSPERGHEIQAWLNDQDDVVSFVIVDDNSDMAHLKPRLVQTTWAEGLLDVHVDRLIALLER